MWISDAVFKDLENSRFDIFRICGTEVAIYKYKIPIIKISTEDLWNIKNNNVKFDSKNIEKIKNRSIKEH